jgi:hypothetical protein
MRFSVRDTSLSRRRIMLPMSSATAAAGMSQRAMPTLIHTAVLTGLPPS